MGRVFNPKNTQFQIAVNSQIYLDKTELIRLTNDVINTEQRFLLITRPRRFGKSMAANMISAYYSRGCDSKEMFSRYKISECETFEKHLNKYNVIHINMVNYIGTKENIREDISYLSRLIIHEIRKENAEADVFDWEDIVGVFSDVFAENGTSFVFIIDEWDCIFRNSKMNSESQAYYLNFLRNLLKDKSYVALAYMTGILPIKKYGEHSAINMFTEISMINAVPYEEFTGFTENEVKQLCDEYDRDYYMMKTWYNGYNVNGVSVYNPKSVVESITRKSYNNYWTSTETYKALENYIKFNFDGLKDKISAMIAGDRVKVNTAKFQNDMTTLNSADDVLTLLIHLGYLTYNATTETGTGEVWIPNSEVQQEFINSIEDGGWENLMKSINASEELLKATIDGDSETVARMVEECHEENTSVLKYNDENSLACVLTTAYYSARNKYVIHRELATGKGYADLVFIPLKNSELPAMVIELKNNKSADTAIEQIKNRNYIQKISQYSGEIILVGINYDEDKGHTCSIEKIVKE